MVYKTLPTRQDDFLADFPVRAVPCPLLLPDVVGSPRDAALP